MHHFLYRNGELYAEEVPIAAIAEEVGTPLYLYSLATLRRHYRVFDAAFAAVAHLVCFSVKANANLALLQALVREGSGFDVVSEGELQRALRVGADPGKIVFSGVGKLRQEVTGALEAGILMVNVESSQELELINDIGKKMGTKARVALRVNPDVDPQTHPYIATGLQKSKFGIGLEDAIRQYQKAQRMPGVEPVGVHCHIGSQLTSVAPFVDALERVKALISEHLWRRGIPIAYLDIGGGLGITYNDENPPDPATYAQALIAALAGCEVTLILEPGRVIVGNAGILVTRVLYRKHTPEKTFLIVDGGMNDLLRPALYGSYHGIQPVRVTTEEKIVADIVGPVCESGDFFARDREVRLFAPGDLMAIMGAGAYGFVMASNYNARPRPAEVLVDGTNFYVIRERETLDDLMRGEVIPPPLR